MSKAPFSKPNVNDVVSSSHVYKIRSSLNHRSRGRLPKSRAKHLFGMVVALLLLGLQLTACGNAAPSAISSASPTSNTTSQPNTSPTTSTPGSTSASTAGPTTGPTTDSTVVPTADPSSFTISQNGVSFCSTGIVGQSDYTVLGTLTSIALKYEGSANPAPGPINWTVSALAGEVGSSHCDNPSSCTIPSGDWLSFDPSSGQLLYNGSAPPVKLQVSHTTNMPVGVYCKKIQFYPVNPNPNGNYTYAELVIADAPTVSNIDPTSGSAAGGTTVTITGYGFTGATGVSFGSTALSPNDFSVDNDTQITATSPAGSGTVDVTVTIPTGTSATGAADPFTYT